MHVFVFVLTDKASQQAPQHTFTNRETRHAENVSKIIKIGNQANIHRQPNTPKRSKNLDKHPTNLPTAQENITKRTPATSFETCSDQVNSKNLQKGAKSIKKCSVSLKNISGWNLEFPLKLGYAMVSDAAFGAKKYRARGWPRKGLSRNNRIFKCSYCDRKLRCETSMIGHVKMAHFPREPQRDKCWKSDKETLRSAPEDPRIAPDVPRIAAEESRIAPERTRTDPEDTRVATENPRNAPENPRIPPEDTRSAPKDLRIAPEDTRIAPNQTKLPFLNKNIEKPLTEQEWEHTSSGVTMQELEFSDNVHAFPVLGIHEKERAIPGYRAEHDVKDISMQHLENSRSSSTVEADDVTAIQTVGGPVSAPPVHGIVVNIAAISQQLVRDNSIPSQGPETKNNASADTPEQVFKDNAVSEHWTLDKAKAYAIQEDRFNSNSLSQQLAKGSATATKENGIKDYTLSGQRTKSSAAAIKEHVTMDNSLPEQWIKGRDNAIPEQGKYKTTSFPERRMEGNDTALIKQVTTINTSTSNSVEDITDRPIDAQYKGIEDNTAGDSERGIKICDILDQGRNIRQEEEGERELVTIESDAGVHAYLEVEFTNYDQTAQNNKSVAIQTQSIDVNCGDISKHDQQSVQTESIDVNCDDISEHDVKCDDMSEHDVDCNNIPSEQTQHSVQTKSIDVHCDNISKYDQHLVQTEGIDVNCDNILEHDQQSVQTEGIAVDCDDRPEHDQHPVQDASIDVNSVEEDDKMVDFSTARSGNRVMDSSLETALNVKFPCQYCDKIYTRPDRRLAHCKSFHKDVYQQGIKDNALVDAGQAVKDNSIINPEKRIKENTIVDLEQGIKDNAIADWEQRIKDNAIADSEQGIKDNAIADSEKGMNDGMNSSFETALNVNDDLKFPCQYCDKIYTRPDRRLKHYKSFHKDVYALGDPGQGVKDNAIADSKGITETEENDEDDDISMARSEDGDKDSSDCDSQEEWSTSNVENQPPDNSSTDDSQSGNEMFKCAYCSKHFETMAKRKLHEKASHLKKASNGKKQFSCQYCDKRYLRLDGVRRHCKSVHKDIYPDEVADFSCENCPEISFSCKSSLSRHLRFCHGNSRPNKKGVHSCEYCSKVFRTKAALKIHIESSKRKAENENFTCKECGEVFGLRCTWRKHAALHVFGCKVCNATFPSEDGLDVHTAQNHKHKIEQEKCTTSDQGNASEDASKTGENATASSQTQENHRVDTINSSQSVGNSSVNSTDVNLDNGSKNTSKTGENTTASSQTQDSLNNVDTINSSQSECDSRVSATDTAQSLDKPVASRNSSSSSPCKTNRPIDTYTFSYPCNYCCKVFHSKKSSGNHLSEHEISRFSCHYCKERFASKKMLMVHFTHHDSSTPPEAFSTKHPSDDEDDGDDLKYACPECGCVYSDIASLKSHIKQQGCQRLSCQHCNKAFRYKRDLRSHLHKHHHQSESALEVTLAESPSTTSKGLPYTRRKVENNKYEYECTKCDKVFDNKRKMSAHLHIHELGESGAEPEFNCELCNEKFWLTLDVLNHAVLEHNDGNMTADATEQQSPKVDGNNLNVKDANS